MYHARWVMRLVAIGLLPLLRSQMKLIRPGLIDLRFLQDREPAWYAELRQMPAMKHRRRLGAVASRVRVLPDRE